MYINCQQRCEVILDILEQVPQSKSKGMIPLVKGFGSTFLFSKTPFKDKTVTEHRPSKWTIHQMR